MTQADSYRMLAAELKAKAAKEANTSLASEWQHLARCYLRLAQQADQNGRFDLAVEVGSGQLLKAQGA